MVRLGKLALDPHNEFLKLLPLDSTRERGQNRLA